MKPPSDEDTKTVASPLPTASTLPLASTVATELSEVPHLKDLSDALSGNMVAVRSVEPPLYSRSSDLSSSIFSTPTPTVT